MKNLISESQNICSKKITIIEKDPTVVNVRNPSNLRAKQFLNWYPKVPLREGLMSLNMSS